MTSVIVTTLILLALLYAQHRHYEYLNKKKEMDSKIELNSELTQTLKEFEDYKKRVDVLSLKAGFKL